MPEAFPALDGIPEELLSTIASCLHDLRAADDVTSWQPKPRRPYKALYNFCLVNRKCRRIGQEALFDHCDVSLRPLRQPFLLVRTLLERPEHAARVHSLKLPLACHDEQHIIRLYFHRMKGYKDAFQIIEEISGMMIRQFRTLDFTPEERLEYTMAKISDPLWSALSLIPCLAGNLRRLVCTEATGVQQPHNMRHIADPAWCDPNHKCVFRRLPHAVRFWSLPNLSVLQRLESFKIGIESYDISELFRHFDTLRWLRRIPVPVYLDWTLRIGRSIFGRHGFNLPSSNRALIDSWDINHFALMRGMFDYRRMTRSLLSQMFSVHHVCLRRLTYEMPCDKYGSIEDPQLIWKMVEKVQDTLEHLVVHYPKSTVTWPQNLQKCQSLTVFEMTGEFFPDVDAAYEDGSSQQLPIEDFFPPNVESLTITTYRVDFLWYKRTKYLESFYRSSEAYLPSVKSNHANIKKLVFGNNQALGTKCWTFDEANLREIEGGIVHLLSGNIEDAEAAGGKKVFDFRRKIKPS